MSVEQHLQLIIGQHVFQIASLQAQRGQPQEEVLQTKGGAR